MPTQPIPEQKVVVVDDRDTGRVRVYDRSNCYEDGRDVQLMVVIVDPIEDTGRVAWELAKEIIAKPAIVHMRRVAFGFEPPRRLLPNGQLGEAN